MNSTILRTSTDPSNPLPRVSMRGINYSQLTCCQVVRLGSQLLTESAPAILMLKYLGDTLPRHLLLTLLGINVFLETASFVQYSANNCQVEPLPDCNKSLVAIGPFALLFLCSPL